MAGIMDGISKAFSKLQDLGGKAVEGAKKVEETVDQAKKAAPEAPKDAMDQIKSEVDAQVEKIRSAATGTDPIHDFMQGKRAEAAAEAPAASFEDAVNQVKAAAGKVAEAAGKAQAAVGEKLDDIADKAKAAYEQARDSAAEKVESAAETAEKVFEGPDKETISEIFETKVPEAPLPDDPKAD